MTSRNLNERLLEVKSNEGCYNCGREEDYNGAENPGIRYLCALCVNAGLLHTAREEFEAIERELKLRRKPLLRMRRSKKDKQKAGTTLANC